MALTVGIGTWAGKTTARLIRGEVRFTISEDENGEYKIDVTLPGNLKNTKFDFRNVHAVDDKTLEGEGEVSLVPGKTLGGRFIFDGDKMSGEITKVPVIRTVKVTDGYRVKE